MADMHPTELELLAHVERELGTERDRVAAHVAGCPICAGTVAELEAGREALRASPLLEPPPDLRRRLSADLDLHEPPRRVYVSSMRLVAVLAPVAVVFALVAAVAALQGGGDDGAGEDQAAQTAPADDAGAEAGGGGGEAPTTQGGFGPVSGATPLVSVTGPPSEVAARLRDRGLEARVEDGSVVVSGGSAQSVRRALAGRPTGPVGVLLE